MFMPNPELDKPPLFDRIALLRELGGFSLNKAALLSGLVHSYLWKLETGRLKTPSPRKLYALAEGINVSYARLMALAGYSKDVSPEEADPIRQLEQNLGLTDLSFDDAKLLMATIREMRLGEEVGVPKEVTGRVMIAAIRAQAGSDGAMDEIVEFTKLAGQGKLHEAPLDLVQARIADSS
jgi:transcriptional regulator with XRE-family HTH domain